MDNLAIQAAFAAEEKARQEAIRRRAEETGDSMWELAVMPSVRAPVGRKGVLGRVKVVGYAEVVAGVVEEEGGVDVEMGKGKRNEEEGDEAGDDKGAEGEADSASSEEGSDDAPSSSPSSPSSDSSIDNQNTHAPSFTHSSGRLTFGNFTRHESATITTTTSDALADSEASPQSQSTPTSSSNPLRGLTSLSIAGSRPRAQTNANKECYNCAQLGHIAAECPRGKKRPRHTDEHYTEDSVSQTGGSSATQGGGNLKRPRGGGLGSKQSPGGGVSGSGGGGGVMRKVKRGGRRGGRGISSGGRR